MELTEEQSRAVKTAQAEGLSIITGGPGTGKTTTVRELVRTFQASGQTVLLVAPTGKAASRITSHVGQPASTIHRALGWRMETCSPNYNATNPLPADVVIVDECSMVDAALARRLCAAVGPNTNLVLLGDDGQLPPVRAGAFFADLIASGVVPMTRLSRVFRQGEGSPITDAAYAVKEGRWPESKSNDAGAFFVVETANDEETLAKSHSCISRLGKSFSITGDENIQLLTPGREGTVSVAAINGFARSAFGAENPTPSRIAVGDKVINTENNYELAVFNGEIGRVLERSRSHTLVDFGDREVCFTASDGVGSLLLAWCLTIHRSQGSEYPAVIVALSETHTSLLTRKLLYTAITRASRVCIVVGTKRSIARCLKNDDAGQRVTTLQARIAEKLAPHEST